MNNQTIETILNHRSVRKFTNEKVTNEQIQVIVKAAQQASTSSYVMAYTIIGVTDEVTKEKLTAVSGQPYVKDNGHLFVFCADLQRIYEQTSKEKENIVQESLESTEQFLVATIDATLAAQNAVIAAESMGLGICFLGSLRNDIRKTNDILDLPKYVIPLFGLAIGYPDEQPEQKPRLPLHVVYHENKYNHHVDEQKQALEIFDQHINSYYNSRSKNKRMDTWTNQMNRRYSMARRMDVTQFIRDKKLNIR